MSVVLGAGKHCLIFKFIFLWPNIWFLEFKMVIMQAEENVCNASYYLLSSLVKNDNDVYDGSYGGDSEGVILMKMMNRWW